MIYKLEERAASAETIGGKAFQLHCLKDTGLSVPAWMVIPACVLHSWIPANPTLFLPTEELEIEADFWNALKHHFHDAEKKYFAVRSSASVEDGIKNSFAGQFETELFVPYEKLPESISKVWLSAFSAGAATYLQTNNISEPVSMSVIIQEMIDADVSGVGFGINPVNGNSNKKVFSSVYGLGPGLVSGALNSDNYFLQNGSIVRQLTAQTEAVVKGEKGAVETVRIDPEKGAQSSLSDTQLMQLAKMLETLHIRFGSPQDIEFAVKEGSVYLLQSRPVTAVNAKHAAEKELIWDNSNIIESYPGLTLPLTYSFVKNTYTEAYLQLAAMLGVKSSVLVKNREYFENMVGMFYGRLYYNLSNWYKQFELLPGFSVTHKFLESTLGVKQSLTGEKKGRSKFSTLMLFEVSFKTIFYLLRLPKQRRKFTKTFETKIHEFQQTKLEELDEHKLTALFRKLEKNFLNEWRTPILNGLFTMIFFGLLKRLLKSWKISDDPGFCNQLLVGQRNIISTEPIFFIMALAKEIKSDPEALKIFTDKDETEIFQYISAVPAVKKNIDLYLEKYGERCIGGELKMEAVTYREDPARFLKILRSYVLNDVVYSTDTAKQEELKTEAVKQYRQALHGKFIKQIIFKYVLKQTCSLVSYRENFRFMRMRAFSQARKIFKELGRKLHAKGILDEQRDIFYLSKEELFSFIQGSSVDTDIRSIVSKRKKQYVQFAEMEIPERFITTGLPYQAANFIPAANVPSSAQLKGIACCPGKIRGRVRIVRSPDELEHLQNDILVAKSADPGWVKLFPTAAAVLMERGSLLSHTGIVTRELGIPCIVGITGLLASVKDGDLIEMDGGSGIVNIL